MFILTPIVAVDGIPNATPRTSATKHEKYCNWRNILPVHLLSLRTVRDKCNTGLTWCVAWLKLETWGGR